MEARPGRLGKRSPRTGTGTPGVWSGVAQPIVIGCPGGGGGGSPLGGFVSWDGRGRKPENVFKKKKAARKSQRQFTGGRSLEYCHIGARKAKGCLEGGMEGCVYFLFGTRFRPEWNPEILGGLVELGGGKLGEVGGDVGGERGWCLGGGRRRRGKLEEREKFLSSLSVVSQCSLGLFCRFPLINCAWAGL